MFVSITDCVILLDPGPHSRLTDTDSTLIWTKSTKKEKYKFSVADPGCLSRIPDPDFYPFRIPDPKTAIKERGEKKFVVIPFLQIISFF
jgi:hypothetical protein